MIEWQGGIFLFFLRCIQLSWFLYSLDSTCFSLFASFLVVMWLCMLLCNYKMCLKHKVGSFFSFFRWIQLSWFLYSLDSTCFILFASFLVVMWLCLLLCNYKMVLKHKAGSFFCFFRWIQLSWFLYSLDSTCFSLFASFLVVMWLCLLLRNYKMFLKHKVGYFFSFFPGFNCFDFYIRWIQHVLVFLHVFLLICGIVCCCVTTRRWSVRQIFVSIRIFLHLKIILTGNYAWPKCRWIQLSWFLYSLDATCFSLFA